MNDIMLLQHAYHILLLKSKHNFNRLEQQF